MICLNQLVKAQIIFLNNPSNHIAAFNPAFSAIHPSFNKNYNGKQVTLSSRVSQNQKDAQLTGQYFFEKHNLGISLDYGHINQSTANLNKVSIGLAYQLLFFNAISTGWGIGFRFNDQLANSNNFTRFYNKEFPDTLNNFQSVDVKFGGLINYERFLFGFSFQPRQLTTIISNNKATTSTSQTLYFKTYKPITRNVNIILWCQASFNKYYISNETKHLRDFQHYSVNLHLAGKKGLIGGIGSRITNFNYFSAIAKLGYNQRKWQILYGIEPYWLQTKYSEIIHDLSFTIKLN